MEPDPGPEMDTESAERLRRVVHRLARYLNADATAEGLTPSQASVLGLVVGHGSLTLAEIVNAEGLNPTMLSRVVTKLNDMGLVTREPSSDDQRVVNVSATRAGGELHQRLKRDRARSVAGLVARLDPALRARVIDDLPAYEALANLANSPRVGTFRATVRRSHETY